MLKMRQLSTLVAFRPVILSISLRSSSPRGKRSSSSRRSPRTNLVKVLSNQYCKKEMTNLNLLHKSAWVSQFTLIMKWNLKSQLLVTTLVSWRLQVQLKRHQRRKRSPPSRSWLCSSSKYNRSNSHSLSPNWRSIKAEESLTLWTVRLAKMKTKF